MVQEPPIEFAEIVRDHFRIHSLEVLAFIRHCAGSAAPSKVFSCFFYSLNWFYFSRWFS